MVSATGTFTRAYILYAISVFLTLLAAATAQLTPVTGASETLLQYGAAQSRHHYLLTIPSTSSIVSTELRTADKKIITSYEINHAEVTPGTHNISVTMFFDGWVGDVAYETSVFVSHADGTNQRHNYAGVHSVYGLVVYDKTPQGDVILSGDDGHGLKLHKFRGADEPGRPVHIATHAPTGVDVQPRFSVRELVGTTDSKLLSANGVQLTGSTLTIAPNAYRVGSGGALVMIESEGLSLHGESLETVLVVSVPATPSPPPVVASAQVVANVSAGSEAHVNLSMFNAKDFVDMELILGPHVLTANRTASQIGEYDQTVAFAGKAEAGVFHAHVNVRDGRGRSTRAVLLGAAEVTLVRVGSDDSDKIAGRTSPRMWVIVVGVCGGLAFAVLVVFAVSFVVWRQRNAELEESFSAWSTVDVSPIARDVYGRGSVSV